MLRSLQHYTTLILIAVSSLFLFQACEDDPLSEQPDEETEQPDLPSFEAITVDGSYFETNQVPEDPENPEDFGPYSEAQAFVLGVSQGVEGALALPQTFLALSTGQEGEQQNNNWVWNFTGDYPDEGTGETVDFTATITASPGTQASLINWEFAIDATHPQYGPISDHVLMSGSVAEDNLTGSWSLFSPDDAVPENLPSLESEWDYTDIQESGFTVTTLSIGDVPEGEEADEAYLAEFHYEQNGDDFTFSLVEGMVAIESGEAVMNEELVTFEVMWNTNTGTGSIIHPNGNICQWGEDLRVTQCEEGQATTQ